MKNNNYILHWYEALSSDVGLCLQVTERKAFMQKLYQARAKEKNPELDGLSILVPRDSDELWIVRKDAISKE